MATVHSRNDSFRILFLHFGKRYSFTLGKVSEKEAYKKAEQADYLLMRISQGLLSVPPGMDISSSLLFDGKPPEDVPATKDDAILGSLRDRYLAAHRGSLEETTIAGIELHFRHLGSVLGDGTPVKSIDQTILQTYADRRAKMKWRKKPIRPATIRKELITLRTAWNWGTGANLTVGRFPPLRKVRFHKEEEKPPFQTYDEIDRRIKLGGLTGGQISELWECLFLRLEEIDQLLKVVEKSAAIPWIYPLVCFAAHTGARRSELLRVLLNDVDFAGQTILIREKKRSHDKRTTRRVPLTPLLGGVLKEWLAVHPGGQHLFAQAQKVVRSKTKRTAATPLTCNEVHDHLKRTLRHSKWNVLRGWHVLRHSFASNCAAQGVDQRLIDAWLGHTTEIRKRYLHLIPSNEQAAILSVFGAR